MQYEHATKKSATEDYTTLRQCDELCATKQMRRNDPRPNDHTSAELKVLKAYRRNFSAVALHLL